MRKLFCALPLLALLLGGCTAVRQGVLQAGIEGVKSTNDTVARTLIQSTCGMTVGAFNRLQSPTDKRGVDMLCGGSGEDQVTLQSLQRFMEAQ